MYICKYIMILLYDMYSCIHYNLVFTCNSLIKFLFNHIYIQFYCDIIYIYMTYIIYIHVYL